MVSRLPLLGVALLAVPVLFAQYTISLHSGSIQYSTGTVLIDDQPFQKTITNAPIVKKGERLTTGADGVAEVLLTPGVFVRMLSNSSLRMDEVLLSDTRVAVLKGSMMVECAEMIKGNSVVFALAGQTVEIRKPGLFRIEADPPLVSVVHGEVFVTGSLNATVTSGKQLALDSAVASLQKSPLSKDDLYQFSETRSADSAYASNVASNGLFSAGSTCMGSTWYWMNAVGMYSYIPCGSYMSPFGYPFFGMNYGYLYDGLPYYYAPPSQVLGGGGFGYGPTGVARLSPPAPITHAGRSSSPTKAVPATRMAVAPARASSSANASYMKIPAFRDVLSTRASEVSVSRAAYLARSGFTPSATDSSTTVAPAGTSQNRFLGATSLRQASPDASAKGSALGALFGHGSSSVSTPSYSRAGGYIGGGSTQALSARGGGGPSYSGGGPSYAGGGSGTYTPATTTSSVSSGRASFSTSSGSSSSGGGRR
jgi:hypothetical protein